MLYICDWKREQPLRGIITKDDIKETHENHVILKDGRKVHKRYLYRRSPAILELVRLHKKLRESKHRLLMLSVAVSKNHRVFALDTIIPDDKEDLKIIKLYDPFTEEYDHV